MKRILLTFAAFAGITMARVAFRDATAIKFRMNAGFPGDVNRMHPASIEPCLIGPTPPTAYGQPVLVDAANGIRPFAAGDVAVTVPYGFSVRSYPTQQTTGGMSSTLGAATPPTSGVMDVLRSGYIMGVLNDIAAVVKKGDAVFVWCAATAGIHIQGGLEVVASGGNTAALDPNWIKFNGPCDPSGNIELSMAP